MTDQPPVPPSEADSSSAQTHGRALMAWLLIGFGILLLLNNMLDLTGGFVLIGLGVAFVAGYYSSGTYGLLIPGMILIGLGLGNVMEDLRPFGLDAEWSTFWLGVGFIGIYLTDRFRRRQTSAWPLWPGGFLVLFGLWDIARELELIDFLWWNVFEDWWPLALIVIGIYLLRPRRNEAEGTPPGPTAGTG